VTSERIQRRIERLLDQSEEAEDREDWAISAQRAREALALQADNQDAQTLYDAALRITSGVKGEVASIASEPSQVVPTSFANGRYQVRRFLGEGGKKKVYLAHDSLLDRDVAFALIKTEGLDAAARQRIIREAQAMGRLGDHPNIVPASTLRPACTCCISCQTRANWRSSAKSLNACGRRRHYYCLV
jgi:hypothetical protein